MKAANCIECSAAYERGRIAKTVFEHSNFRTAANWQKPYLAIAGRVWPSTSVKMIADSRHDVGSCKHRHADKVLERGWQKQIVVINKNDIVTPRLAHACIARCAEIEIAL